MSRQELFKTDSSTVSAEDFKAKLDTITRNAIKIEPDSEVTHEFNKIDLEHAVKALEHIAQVSPDKDAVHVAEVALDKISLGDFDEGKRFPYLVRHMPKHKQPVKKGNGVWVKPNVTLESNTYNCKYNGSESVHQLYYNNFTGQWSTIGTSAQPELTVTAPDLIQII